MNALIFTLSGETAMFKKPDVNKTTYFTFMHIHKPVILGLFGALLGLNGYADCTAKGKEYPDYYTELKDLPISIIPVFKSKQYSFMTTIQTFTNTTAQISKEYSLIIREQWLKSPCWQIIVKDDKSDAFKKLKDVLLNQECYFEPYLGKNDHPATITDVKECSIKEVDPNEFVLLKSLSLYEDVLETKGAAGRVRPSMYKEYMPIGLNHKVCDYIQKEMFLTNQLVKMKCPVYQYDHLFFTLN